MRNRLFLFGLFMVIFGVSVPVHASISYDVQNLGENVWQYGYTVSNDNPSTPIKEFTIYFENGLYQALLVDSSVTGWTEMVVEPRPSGNSGFYYAIASGTGIGPGNAMGGFLVSFEWLGSFGPPMPQYFEVYADNLALLDSGITTPTAVPVPGTLVLLSSGLLFLVGLKRNTGIYNAMKN